MPVVYPFKATPDVESYVVEPWHCGKASCEPCVFGFNGMTSYEQGLMAVAETWDVGLQAAWMASWGEDQGALEILLDLTADA